MAAPQVSIVPLDSAPDAAAWRVRWRVTNTGSTELRLVRVLAPHGRFRATDRAVNQLIAPQATAELAAEVAFTEPPGAEVENAFLILIARCDAREWRILARLRVGADANGAPRPLTERIDVQEVGFSGSG